MQHPDLLVGIDTGDDAAVYRLTDDLAIVQTIDFFPPIVDDPYQFGAIAAANALSDVYAMGGRPILALNVVCFPDSLPKRILGEVLRGGSDVAAEADVLIAGGHTLKDAEPKYGMSVTGTLHPDALVTNAGAQPGDVLVLTKPIGTGIVTTAAKAGSIDPAVLDAAVDAMRRLNRNASLAMQATGVHAATDVTGFGLIGHLLGMMRGSRAAARIDAGAVPVLPGVRDLLAQGIAPGGTRNNLAAAAEPHVAWSTRLTENDRLLLCDAQTSGGLLIAVARERLPRLLDELNARGVPPAVIGTVTETPAPFITIDG